MSHDYVRSVASGSQRIPSVAAVFQELVELAQGLRLRRLLSLVNVETALRFIRKFVVFRVCDDMCLFSLPQAQSKPTYATRFTFYLVVTLEHRYLRWFDG